LLRLLKSKLRKALVFSFSDWGRFIEAYILVLAVDIGLHLLGFWRVYNLIADKNRSRTGRPHPPEKQKEIDRISSLVRTACRNHFCRAECLHRSLVLYWLLTKRGFSVELCIGVRKDKGEFSAHAWLEYDGEVLKDSPLVRKVYSPMIRSQRG